MRLADLEWLITVFGREAKVVDVMNALRLIAEEGEKLRRESDVS